MVLKAELVDLDKPGALESLKREKPDDYAKVMRAAGMAQAVPPEPGAPRDLFFDPRKPDPTRRQVQTSDPARTKITVFTGKVLDSLTVVYLKHPPSLVGAR